MIFSTQHAQKLYQTAKNALGTHQTLNPMIPSEVGCAEAVSAILRLAGVSVPAEGIPGTTTLDQWLSSNHVFQKIDLPEVGCIILSPTGSGNGNIPGHTGIMGALGVAVPNGYGIMSNDSNTGLFLELWTFEKWKQYYQVYGGLKVNFYRYV